MNNSNPMAMASINFGIVKRRCEIIIALIQETKEELINILMSYQPYHVCCYEIERCVRTLHNIDDNKQYFEEMIACVSIFLPSNLPLYSFVLFALIPSFLSCEVFVYPNQILQKQETVDKLCDILLIKKYFQNIKIVSETHDTFIEKYVKKSQLVIFTGRNETKDVIKKAMKNDSVLIYNGSGHNPIVVSNDADITKSVEDSVYVKFFNSGQDCGGPDVILVHKDISESFIKQFKERCSQLKVGNLSDKEVFIGPIQRQTELERLKEIIDNNKLNIIHGGHIDFRKKLVYPTIIFSKMTESVNFKEIFGPIVFIVEYETDEHLRLYFQDESGKYQSNKMYVSLYGNSRYIKERDDRIRIALNRSTRGGVGIVLFNETIHDVEIGTKPYGGYSKGASSVIIKRNETTSSVAFPILISEIITELLIKNNSTRKLQTKNVNILKTIPESKSAFVLKIEMDFKEHVTKIFGNNLEFAFIFGSIAQGTYKLKTSDIDTFICLKQEEDPKKLNEYQKWIINYQLYIDLNPDFNFPCEIVTYSHLKRFIMNLDDITINFYCNDFEIFDKIFWACTLPSFHKKQAFVGGVEGGKKLSYLAKTCGAYPKKWAKEFIDLVQNVNTLPISLQGCYQGFDKDQVVEALCKLYKKHEYCEIMRLIDFSKTKMF